MNAGSFAREKLFPRHVSVWTLNTRERNHALDRGAARRNRFVDNPGQRHILALAIRDVGGEDEPRAAGLDAIGERLRAEAGEHDRMNRADPHDREHQRDRFLARRHVDRDAVAFRDPNAAQGCREALHVVKKLGVGLDGALAAFVDADQRRAPALPREHMTIDRVVAEIGFRSEKPTERRRLPLEDAVPGTKPRQLGRGPSPERVRIPESVLDPPANRGSDRTQNHEP